MTYGRVYVFFYEEVVRSSSFLKARDKQPQVRLFTSIYDFTRIFIGLIVTRDNLYIISVVTQFEVGWARDNVQS